MAKVVYNACHGGFSLSEAGMRRYCEIKGIQVWPVAGKYAAPGIITYWIVPPHQRIKPMEGDEWSAATIDERRAYNARYSAQTINARDFERHDPALVQVVEELGAEANGRYANLAIYELPDGARYRIDEYDGSESVMEPDDYEWTIAA